MIGAIIQNLRKNVKLTQDELAEKLAISRSALSLYETEKRKPDYETLSTIADFFHVSTDYLIGRTTDLHLEKREKNRTSLTENETEMLHIFRKLKERDQIKVIGKMEVIIESILKSNVENFQETNVAQSISSQKDVG